VTSRITSFIKDRAVWAIVLAGSLFFTTARPAMAIFGFGDVVFDPTAYATLGHIWSQDISNYAKMAQTVMQLEKIYASGMQMYTLGRAMSQSFDGAHKAEWASVAQMGMLDYTQDKYGENSNWAKAISGAPSQVPGAWQRSTLALNGRMDLSSEAIGHSPSLASLSTVEAMDGSSQKCLATISQYRGNSLANQFGPILKLAIARADGTSKTNSQVQQLNILAAQQEQGNTETRAHGQIDACLVEQQVLANKTNRDALVQHMNVQAQAKNYYTTEGSGDGGYVASLRSAQMQ
jgi:hypothetical protein